MGKHQTAIKMAASRPGGNISVGIGEDQGVGMKIMLELTCMIWGVAADSVKWRGLALQSWAHELRGAIEYVSR